MSTAWPRREGLTSFPSRSPCRPRCRAPGRPLFRLAQLAEYLIGGVSLPLCHRRPPCWSGKGAETLTAGGADFGEQVTPSSASYQPLNRSRKKHPPRPLNSGKSQNNGKHVSQIIDRFRILLGDCCHGDGR